MHLLTELYCIVSSWHFQFCCFVSVQHMQMIKKSPTYTIVSHKTV